MHPHDQKLALSWKFCRWAISRLKEHPELKNTVQNWIDKHRHGAPEFLGEWEKIIHSPDASAIFYDCNFEDLPENQRGYYRGLIQSHPFSALLSGKTHERRAILSRL